MSINKKKSKRSENVIENEKDVLSEYNEILYYNLAYKKRRIISDAIYNHIK